MLWRSVGTGLQPGSQWRDRGSGRTYSGVWAAGQATGNGVSAAGRTNPDSRKTPDSSIPATVPKAWSGRDTASGALEMAAAKKREIRKSVQQPGWITLDGGFAARPCVVQDLSSTGAKVTVDDPNTLPGRLRLAFSRDARTGRSCEVVWRRGKTVGIKFVR